MLQLLRPGFPAGFRQLSDQETMDRRGAPARQPANILPHRFTF